MLHKTHYPKVNYQHTFKVNDPLLNGANLLQSRNYHID